MQLLHQHFLICIEERNYIQGFFLSSQMDVQRCISSAYKPRYYPWFSYIQFPKHLHAPNVIRFFQTKK